MREGWVELMSPRLGTTSDKNFSFVIIKYSKFMIRIIKCRLNKKPNIKPKINQSIPCYCSFSCFADFFVSTFRRFLLNTCCAQSNSCSVCFLIADIPPHHLNQQGCGSSRNRVFCSDPVGLKCYGRISTIQKPPGQKSLWNLALLTIYIFIYWLKL